MNRILIIKQGQDQSESGVPNKKQCEKYCICATSCAIGDHRYILIERADVSSVKGVVINLCVGHYVDLSQLKKNRRGSVVVLRVGMIAAFPSFTPRASNDTLSLTRSGSASEIASA